MNQDLKQFLERLNYRAFDAALKSKHLSLEFASTCVTLLIKKPMEKFKPVVI